MYKQSLQSKVVEYLLNLYKKQQKFSKKQNIEPAIKKRLNSQKNYSPFFIYNWQLEKTQFLGMDVYQNKIKNFDNVILYIHGGSFIANPNLFQWKMILEIAKKSNSLVIAPLYPKAPFNTYTKTFDILPQLYMNILKNYPNTPIHIIGDSAGGNIAFVLAQFIKENKLPPPKNTILLSPCLDLTLSNPDIVNYEDKDPSLTVNALKQAYKLWAGNQDLTYKMLSPINGDLNINSNLYVFVGTHEILYPEIKQLKNICQHQNIKMTLIERQNLNHVYPAFPIPEGRQARKDIANIITEKTQECC